MSVCVVNFDSPGSVTTLDVVSSVMGGLTPVAVVIYASMNPNDGSSRVHSYDCIGFAVNGGNQRCHATNANDPPAGTTPDAKSKWRNDSVGVQPFNTTISQVNVSAWITNGVRLNFSVNSADAQNRRYQAVFFYGAGVQAAVGTINPSGVNPTVGVSGLGFTPDFVLVASNGSASASNVQDTIWQLSIGAATPTQNACQARNEQAITGGAKPNDGIWNDRCFVRPTAGAATISISGVINNFVAGGFDFVGTGTFASENISYLAVYQNGKRCKLEVLTAPTSTGSVARTGYGWPVAAVMGVASGHTAVNTLVFDNAQASSWTFFTFDGNFERSKVFHNPYNVTPSPTSQSPDTAFAVSSDASAVATQASRTSMDADGYTLNWTAVSGSAAYYWQLAFEGAVVTPVVPIRDTQTGIELLSKLLPDIRATQFGLEVLSKHNPKIRVSQMGVLMLARGAAGLLVPDSLSLGDRGRSMVIRQRLVNMYSEPTPQGPSTSVRIGRPGLYEATTRGQGPIRAIFLWKYGVRVVVSGDTVYINDFAVGTIPNPDNMPVRWAISDDECVIISNNRPYYVTPYDVTLIVNENLLNVIDVKFLGGRFVYVLGDGSGRYFFSASGDALTVDGLSFISAESDPDPISACEKLGDALVFFNTRTTEFHYTSADPAAPFQRSNGRRYDKGSKSPHSIVSCDNTLVFLGSDRKVYRAEAVPVVISNDDIADRTRRVTDEELPNVTAFTVNFGNHEFYVMNLPDQGSWAYDFSQKVWAEWKSWNRDRFRVNVAQDNVLGDIHSGKLLGMDGQTFDDLGDPLERICSAFAPLRGRAVRNFNLALMCKRGVGLATGNGSSPHVEMRMSDNQDGDWTKWRPAPLGELGDRTRRAMALWTNLGAIIPPGRQYEFRCTDPVEFLPYELKYNEVRP